MYTYSIWTWPHVTLQVISSSDIEGFRAAHGLPATTQIFGPFIGLTKGRSKKESLKFTTLGKKLVLQFPDKQDEAFTPYLQHDIVDHNSDWPGYTGEFLSFYFFFFLVRQMFYFGVFLKTISIFKQIQAAPMERIHDLSWGNEPKNWKVKTTAVSCPCPDLDACTVSTCVNGLCEYRLACTSDAVSNNFSS